MDNKNQDVAKTILTQMGGINRISAMVSGHNFVSDTNMVKFHFKGLKKANIVRITLTPCDRTLGSGGEHKLPTLVVEIASPLGEKQWKT